MPNTLTDVQAEELRQFVLSVLSPFTSYGGYIKAPIRVLPDGTLLHDDADGVQFVINVQPRGLAELQAGLIEKVRAMYVHQTVYAAIARIGAAIEAYDTAMTSLGTGKGGV